jgi:hypothetical protein
VQCYAPELEKRCRSHLKATTDSWRVDETYVKVKKCGCTSIALWIRRETLWNFCSVPHEMLKQPNASSRKRLLRPIPALLESAPLIKTRLIQRLLRSSKRRGLCRTLVNCGRVNISTTSSGKIIAFTLRQGQGNCAHLLDGMEHGLKESLNRAWSYLKAVQDRLGLAPTLAQKDVVAEAIDLSGGHVECTCGVAFLVAMLSALGQKRVQAGSLVLGDLTIQGNIKALPSITEILQMALENGALRALLPTGNKVQFSGLPEEVVEKIDIIFYSDVDRAITKAVEV